MAVGKKKALVIRAYTDKVDGKVHLKGEEVDLVAARLAELEKGGFVKAIDAPKAAPRAKRED